MTADQKMAKILYIDFGNEEDVPVDRIKPLDANIKPFAPCVSTYVVIVGLIIYLVSCLIIMHRPPSVSLLSITHSLTHNSPESL